MLATYWKDYLGKVPEDAVPGGTERGITTYIGQALHELPNGKLIPGPIDDTKKHMTYNWDGKSYVTTKNIKVSKFKFIAFFVLKVFNYRYSALNIMIRLLGLIQTILLLN